MTNWSIQVPFLSTDYQGGDGGSFRSAWLLTIPRADNTLQLLYSVITCFCAVFQIVESSLTPLCLQVFYSPLTLIAKLEACVHCTVAKLKYSADPQTIFSYCTYMSGCLLATGKDICVALVKIDLLLCTFFPGNLHQTSPKSPFNSIKTVEM